MQVRAEELLSMWQASSGIPFNSLDTPQWKEFVKALRGDFVSPSRHTLERRLDALYTKTRGRLKEKLSTVRSIAICIDGWSDHMHMETLGMTLLDLEQPEKVWLWTVDQQDVRQTAENIHAWIQAAMIRGAVKPSSLHLRRRGSCALLAATEIANSTSAKIVAVLADNGANVQAGADRLPTGSPSS
eukprot:EG_transcript_15882